MFYFLCEGEKYKSDYTFISAIINEFVEEQKYDIHTSNGNRNIFARFLDLTSKFKPNDIFILLFDRVDFICLDNSGVGGLNVNLMLDNIGSICAKLGVFFRHSMYYCFEELFLTYKPLLPILGIEDEFKLNLKEIQDYILQGYNYFNVCDLTYWENRYQHRKGVLRTRESLSSYICLEITRSIKGNFKITKDSIGSCWVSDCKDTTLHRNVCSQCKFPCKSSSFRNKLADLDNNSVSKLSLPFSSIFDTD